MTKSVRRNLCLFACSLAAAAVLPANADTIFANSSTDLKLRLDPGLDEVGDQIILGSTGILTNFSFEYWGTATGVAFAGANVEARVRFYEMDGTPFNGYATPQTVLFDSDWFSVEEPTDRNTFVFGASDFGSLGLSLQVKELTWSVQFRGMGAGDAVGVDVYSPPTVGQDYPDYWHNVSGAWVLETNSAGPINFAARFEATIPEPSTLTLLLGGGLIAVIIITRRRR